MKPFDVSIAKAGIFMVLAFLPSLSLIAYIQIGYRLRRVRSRLPIKEDLPRPAGFSLQARLQAMNDEFGFLLVGLFFAGGLAAFFFVFQNSWLGACLVGVIVVLPLFIYLTNLVKRFWNHNLGLFGEQAVGAALTGLLAKGCRVFHDLEVHQKPRKPWNIDHIVVSPQGVFCIETKTRRKLNGRIGWEKKGWQVTFDGNQLQFPAGWDRHGLEQVEQNANWLRKFLRDSAAEVVAVEPVLVLPGWYVDRKARGKVKVVNEKEIAGVVSTGARKLDEKQIQRISYQLHQRCLMPIG